MTEYTEQDAWFYLGMTGLPFFRTGSREVCSPPVMDTDVDFVVLDIRGHLRKELLSTGFRMCEGVEDNEYGQGDFHAYRKGEVNLIVVTEWPAFKAWRAATAAAKQMNLTDKAKRIALFQGVLYGNW